MENQFYILPCFYRYNSEKMPTISIERQVEIIKKTSTGKTLSNLTFPIIKEVLREGVNIKNQREFRVLLNKKKSFLIKEGTYFLALSHIFLNSSDDFLDLNKKTVLKKYITKTYLAEHLTKQLFILNDVWKAQDFAVKDGVDGYYTLIQEEISALFSDKKRLGEVYTFLKSHEETLRKLEYCGILGYYTSNYLRFAELGHDASYMNSEEYKEITDTMGHKIKWLFKSWDDYLLSVGFGGMVADFLGIYNDFLPLNRLLYNIKAMVQYLPEIFENTNIWQKFEKEEILGFLNTSLATMEITKMSGVEFLSNYNTYFLDVMNAAFFQFQNILLPVARENDLELYFTDKHKNSFLIFPTDPFTADFDLEELNFLSRFSQGEYPLAWDNEVVITNHGIWSRKNRLGKKDVVFLDKDKIKNIKIRLKNDLSFQLRVKGIPVLNLSARPERFNQTLEEFYLSKRSVIKRKLNFEIPRFEKFFKELFLALNS